MQFLCQTGVRWRRTSYRCPENTSRKPRNRHVVGKVNKTTSKNSYSFISSCVLMSFVILLRMGLPVFARVLYCAIWSLPKPHGKIPQGFGLTLAQIFNKLRCSSVGSSLLQLKPNCFATEQILEYQCSMRRQLQLKSNCFVSYHMQISRFSERVLRAPIARTSPPHTCLA